MKTYKATIIPTVSGGNIEVKICANSQYQAQELIKTLPYFKAFAKKHPMQEDEKNNLTSISDLIKRANAKKQADLGKID